MDEFDRAMHARIAQLERQLSAATRDVATLITALSLHEGRSEAATMYRHLGRTPGPDLGRLEDPCHCH